MAIKLPSIEQDVEIDTSDLARAIAAAEAFGKAMERALKVDSKSFKKSLADINAELENTERQTRATADSFNTLGDAINRMNTRIQATRSGIANLRQDMSNLDRDSKNVGRNFDSISAAVDKLANSTRRGHSSLRDYVNELSKIGQNLGNAGAGLRGVIGNVDDLDDSLRRSSNTIRDYNDALGNMKSGTGGSGPRMDEDFDDTANSANRAEKELDELRSAAAKLAATLAALEGVVEVVNDRLDNLGDGANNAEIEHLKSEIEELKRELAEVTTAAIPASQAVKRFGNNAREAAGDVALLSAASAALNAALAPEIIIKASELGTMFSAITGVVGAIGGALGQVVAGGIGLGTALAPIANLAGIIPSMITGVALLGVTIKSAFNTDVTNEYTESIKAGKKEIEELGNRLVTVIQGQTTPAFRRLVDSAKELSPILETGFRSMGRVVQEVMDDISGNFFLGNPEFQDRFAKLFDSAAVQARNYGYVATNSLFAVTIAAAKGIPVAEKLSETFKDMSNRFLNFIRRAATDGSLEAAFEKGYQTLMRVVSVVGSLGTGFANLGRVAKDVGLDESILASFERGSTGIRNFGRTYRESLSETFSNAKGLFDELGGLISQISRTILLDLGRINLAPLARELTGIVEVLGKMALPAGNALVEGFRDIFAAVNDARAPLVNITTVLSGALTSLGDFGATIIPKLIGPLQQISVEVNRFVSDIADIAADLVPALTGPLVQVVQSSRRMVTAIVETVAPLVKLIAQPFADAFSLIQDTIAQTATAISGPLQGAVGDVLPALSDAFREVVPAVGELVTKIFELVAAFSNSFGGAITGVVSILTPIIDVFTMVAEAAALLPDPLKAVVVALLSLRLISGLGPMIGGLAGHFTGLAGAIAGAYAGAGGGLAGLRAGLGSFMTFLGGPWGLVLAGAATALVLFGMSQQDAKQQAAEHKAALQELAGTMDQVTGKATALTAKKIGENLIDKGLVDDLERFGGNMGQVINAVGKGGAALDEFKNTSIASFLAAVEGSDAYKKELGQVSAKTGESTSEAKRALDSFAKSSSFSMQALAQSWAGGNNSYTAFAEKIASETGRSVSSVKSGFEAIRSAIDSSTGGAASSLSSLGNEIGNVEEASLSVRQVFEGMASGAAEALREVDGFSQVTDQQLIGALDKAYRTGTPVAEALSKIGITGQGAAVVIAALGDMVDGTNGKLVGTGDAAAEIERALQGVADQAAKGIPGAEDLADAFQKIGDQASTAADKAKALQDILEIMNGSTKAVQEAQFDWAESLDQVRAKITSLNEENAGFVQGINDSNGVLDKNNHQHREFRKNLDGMVDDYSMVNASIYQNTKASQGQEAALQAVYQSAKDQRRVFTDTLEQMGLSSTAAQKLADDLGMIPEHVRLGFLLDGSSELVQTQVANVAAQLANMPEGEVRLKTGDITQESLDMLKTAGYDIQTLPTGEIIIRNNIAETGAAVDSLAAQVRGIPTGTLVVEESSVTAGTRAALEDLGFKVTTLPGGKIAITADTATATAEVNGLIAQVTAMPTGTINVQSSAVTKETQTALETMGYTVTNLPNGTTNITSNAAIVQAEVDSLRAKVEKSMEGIIVIDSETTTSEAIGRLEDLGYKIETTPDGDFIITDNTPDANSRIDGVKSNINSIPDGDTYIRAETGAANANIADTVGKINAIPDGSSNVNVTTTGVGSAESSINNAARPRTATITVVSVGGGPRAVADGGIMMPMAKGGITKAIFNAVGNIHDMYRRGLRNPMSNNIAEIVAPNTPRVIGDNVRRPELFLPIDRTNGRSLALLRQGAFMMGFDIVDRLNQQNRPKFFAEGGIAASALRRDSLRVGKTLSDISVSRTAITAALSQQGQAIGRAIQAQSAQLTKIVESVGQGTGAAGNRGETNFTFYQYNPQVVPADEMINSGLQVVAAAGLV